MRCKINNPIGKHLHRVRANNVVEVTHLRLHRIVHLATDRRSLLRWLTNKRIQFHRNTAPLLHCWRDIRASPSPVHFQLQHQIAMRLRSSPRRPCWNWAIPSNPLQWKSIFEWSVKIKFNHLWISSSPFFPIKNTTIKVWSMAIYIDSISISNTRVCTCVKDN